MRYVINNLLYLLIVVTWLMGIVIAKGAWSTFFTIIFAPYAWYLVIEKIMTACGLV